MNRVINKIHSKTVEHFEEISKFEQENDLKEIIESGLSSIFLISNKIPLKKISDFFSGENFSIHESFEELEASYHLAKYGFYKQSMITLRVALDIGVLSIYWSIIGTDDERFKDWYASKIETPRKGKEFWKVFNRDKNIAQFARKFDIRKEIDELGFLSDFVHTKGISHSNFGEIGRNIKGIDRYQNFMKWLDSFKGVVRVLEILHLLRYPTICIDYSVDFLLSKFGTFNKIPQFGAGLGDEKKYVVSFLEKTEVDLITSLSNQNEEVQSIKKWIEELPDLEEEEIREIIFEEQKNNILNSGYKNWEEFSHVHDHRIDDEMKIELRKWAQNKGCMTLDEVMK